MLLWSAGILSPGKPGRLENLRTNLERGVLFCFVYETYLRLSTPAPLSFEHAWYLVEAIHCGYDLDLTTCTRCRLSFVRDPLALRPKICPSCSIKDRDTQSCR